MPKVFYFGGFRIVAPSGGAGRGTR
jgi:hypothetical protein